MIDPERPKMFDKSRPFFGAFEGASRATEIFKNGRMVGFEVSDVAASPAVTLHTSIPMNLLFFRISVVRYAPKNGPKKNRLLENGTGRS